MHTASRTSTVKIQATVALELASRMMKQIDDSHQSQLDAIVEATLKSVNKPWKLKLRGFFRSLGAHGAYTREEIIEGMKCHNGRALFTDYDMIMLNCGVQRNTCNDVAEAAKMAIAYNPNAEMEISINDLSTIRGI
jgi:hypothetical protein